MYNFILLVYNYFLEHNSNAALIKTPIIQNMLFLLSLLRFWRDCSDTLQFWSLLSSKQNIQNMVRVFGALGYPLPAQVQASI